MSNQSINGDLLIKKCQFCKTKANSPLLGEKYCTNTIVVHYHCLLLSNNISQNGADNEGILGFLPDDIRDALKRCKKMICHYCQKNGASIICKHKNCKVRFHLPCGLNKGASFQFQNDFPSFCADHRKIQRLSKGVLSEKQVICVICIEDVNIRRDRRSIIWAECCKRQTFMHRICIQQYADNAGYDTKCPNCSNRTEFVACLLKNGIFCPLREASWEMNDSFNDLLCNDRCCMRICKADSRIYNRYNSLWELITCSRCLAFTAHRACSGVHLLTESFLCELCQAAIRKELPPEPTDATAKPCAVEQCINPNGRYSFSTEGEWKGVQCEHCSNFVAHYRCCGSNNIWHCNNYFWPNIK